MRKNLSYFKLFSYVICVNLLGVPTAIAEDEIEYRLELLWPRLEQPWYFNSPADLAVAPDGSVYIADSGNNRIQHFSAEGDLIRTWGSPGSGDGQFVDPTGIAIAPDHNLYVVDYFDDRVQQFSPEGVFIRAWGTSGSGEGEFSFPTDLAIGPNGHVYVADSDNYRIQQFNAKGEFIRAWGSEGSGNGQFVSLAGLAIASDGNTAYLTKIPYELMASRALLRGCLSNGYGFGRRFTARGSGFLFCWPIGIEAIAFNNPSIAYFKTFPEKTINCNIPSLKICTVVIKLIFLGICFFTLAALAILARIRL